MKAVWESRKDNAQDFSICNGYVHHINGDLIT